MRLLVNVDVDSLERGIAFYQNGLGLQLARCLFNGSVAEMRGASSRIYLLENPPDTPATSSTAKRRDYSRHWTPVHLDFEVDDVAVAVRRAVTAGAKLESEIQTYSWGRLVTMSDPFGHGFCLLQFSNGSYDEAE